MSLKVGWVQYNSDYAAYLPYAVGLLQAYAEHHAPGAFTFLRPRVFAAPLDQEAEALESADVVGFSCYVWNIERSLALAARLKARKPDILIVFGGPQVPAWPEAFLQQYPQVDLCCRGEGEACFLALLQSYQNHRSRDFSPASGRAIPGISGRDTQGQFYQHAPAPRKKDLENLPSPYLEGTFTPLLEAYPQVHWSILWETNRGCPFTCGFCDWASATAAKVHRFDVERLKAELEWFSQQRFHNIFCCDANFGMFPRDLELAEYAVKLHQETGFPAALAVQNAKNVSDRTFAIQCLLAETGLDSHVTLSLQSLYPPALKASGRANISLADFERLQTQLRARRIHTYTDLILGLPGETLDSFIAGYCEVVERGQCHAINVYILDLLPNAPMSDPHFRQSHGLQTVKVPAVNFHRPVREKDPDGIIEWQELVVATQSMPAPDWVQARAFIWWAELLLFKPGLLRIPLLLLQHLGQISMETLLRTLIAAPNPLFRHIHRYFEGQARKIQQGHPMYVPVSEQINGQGELHWKGPYDAVLQLLIRDGHLGLFYAESEALLRPFFAQTQSTAPQDFWQDALFFSASYAHLLHDQDLAGLDYTTRWNAWEVYQGVLTFQTVPVSPLAQRYVKPWRGAPWRLERLPPTP